MAYLLDETQPIPSGWVRQLENCPPALPRNAFGTPRAHSARMGRALRRPRAPRRRAADRGHVRPPAGDRWGSRRDHGSSAGRAVSRPERAGQISLRHRNQRQLPPRPSASAPTRSSRAAAIRPRRSRHCASGVSALAPVFATVVR